MPKDTKSWQQLPIGGKSYQKSPKKSSSNVTKTYQFSVKLVFGTVCLQTALIKIPTITKTSSKVTESYQMIPKITKSYPKIPIHDKSYQKWAIVTINYQKIPIYGNSYQKLGMVTKCYQKIQGL